MQTLLSLKCAPWRVDSMYQEFWKLNAAPFENTPDPRFFYHSPQHEEGLARMLYVVQGRKGAGVLSGIFGCGKTLLARSLMSQLNESQYRVAYISNPLMSDVELLHALAHRLHISDLPDRRSDVLLNEVLSSIEAALKENARDGKETVVLIDEAHLITDKKVIEQLRLLLNFQEEDRFLLTLLLMGQPEVRDVIERHKPLAQRIAMGYQLGPFDTEQTAAYVQHRMQVAGSVQSIFTPDGIQALQDHSGGIPRRINQLADLALLSGMEKQSQEIDGMIVKDAVESVGV